MEIGAYIYICVIELGVPVNKDPFLMLKSAVREKLTAFVILIKLVQVSKNYVYLCNALPYRTANE
jgi:hypothetical protein